VTIEPDTYPPSDPGITASLAGQCASDGIYVSWGPSTDPFSTISYYSVTALGDTTAFSFTDYNVQASWRRSG